MILQCLLLILGLCWAWDCYSRKYREDMLKAQNIKGPGTYPFVGNALQFIGVNGKKMLDYYAEQSRKYGKVYRVWILNKLYLEISDGKYIDAILSNSQLIEKGKTYNLIKPWLNNGLLTSSGDKWRRRRKIITPTFHNRILEDFLPIFVRQSEVLVKKLYKIADGKSVININSHLCLLGLDIITETAMGVCINAQNNPTFEYTQAVESTTRSIAQRIIRPLQHNELYFRLTQPKFYNQFKSSISIMHTFTDQVIRDRRAALNNNDDQQTDINGKKRLAFLDMLLQSTIDGKPLSNADIHEEVNTIMFAGHDTSANVMSYCLYLISQHAAVQQQAVDETLDVLGHDKTSAPTCRQLQELNYLDCVLKETMRIYPIVPILERMTKQNVQIGDITVPANTELRMMFHVHNRDPEYFPEPNTFRPERFYAENGTEIYNSLNAFWPFSGGLRSCVGQKFAMLEMKCVISSILRHFELLPLGAEPEPVINLVLRSANGVQVGLKPRIV